MRLCACVGVCVRMCLYSMYMLMYCMASVCIDVTAILVC